MIFKLCNNGKSVIGTKEDGAMVSYSIEAEEYKAWLSEGNTPEPEDVYVAPAPTVVSPLQARLALNEIGLRQAVENAVAVATQDIKDFYEFALEWKRDNKQLKDMATSLGMTSVDLDNFFLLASTK